MPHWVNSDDEYLTRAEDAVEHLRNAPGKPKRISIAVIGRIAGIAHFQRKCNSAHLPKTRAFVLANADTLEQWQKRKILWSVREMRTNGEVITVYKVRHAATIEDKERKLDGFIMECINNIEKTATGY